MVIDAAGWGACENPPVRFRQAPGALALPVEEHVARAVRRRPVGAVRVVVGRAVPGVLAGDEGVQVGVGRSDIAAGGLDLGADAVVVGRPRDRPEHADRHVRERRVVEPRQRELHRRVRVVRVVAHHCIEPGCLLGCPVRAYEKDAETGIVRHLDDQCIGCQYCVLKCPYDVPKYSGKHGIVRKCDMCHQRLGAGEAPACAQACPTHAIKIIKV